LAQANRLDGLAWFDNRDGPTHSVDRGRYSRVDDQDELSQQTR